MHRVDEPDDVEALHLQMMGYLLSSLFLVF
jgi:hypothetical protein